jgi:hypothetical protein
MNSRVLLCLVPLLIGTASAAPARPVPCAECFPVEDLSAEDAQEADRLLLQALDSEALYTIVGGLKPMSAGFIDPAFDTVEITDRDSLRVEKLRSILGHLRCGSEYYADLEVFPQLSDGKRRSWTVIINRPRFADTIRENRTDYAFFGITPNSHPIQALTQLYYYPETAPGEDASQRRHKAIGLLFGYPQYAAAHFAANTGPGELGGQATMTVPTFRNPNHGMWIVPPDHSEAPDDRTFKEHARRILLTYRRKRAEYESDGRIRTAALLRDWFNDGTGQCASSNAVLDP